MTVRRMATFLLLAALLLPSPLFSNERGASGEIPQNISGQALQAVNDFRIENGLPPLRWDPLLADLAREHAAHMDQMGRMNHDNFQQRYESSGGGVCVENVAWNMNTPQALLDGWKNSAQHRQNLLSPRVTRGGIGRQGYFTTFFACDQ